MKRTFQRIVMALALSGVVLPQPVLVRAAETAVVPAVPAVRVRDVALPGGALTGYLLNPAGQPVVHQTIAIHRDGKLVQTVITARDGSFRAQQMTPGIYAVSTAEASLVARAWSEQAAPPVAARSVVLVQGETVRGQLGNWTPGQFGLGALLVGGAIAAIVVVAADHSSGS